MSVRTAGWAGVATAVVFPIVVVAAATRHDGYSHLTQKISELAGDEATSPALQTLNFLLLGAGAAAVAVGLAVSGRRQRLGATLIALFGVASGWLGAAFPCDAGCAGETSPGLAHNLFGLTGFLSIIAAMFVLPRAWTASPTWSGPARITRYLRLAATVGLVWFMTTQALDQHATAGVAQRLLAASVLSWIGVIGWTLARSVRHESAPAPS